MAKSNLIIRIDQPELRYSPLVRDGIPDFLPGSRDYEDYWAQVRLWCLEGYKPPKGDWIPPNYFWHLNIWNINRRRFDFDSGTRGNKIDAYPLYRDVDAEIIFKTLWEIKCEKKGGGIYGKRRRAGFSDDMTSHLHWEASMFPSNSVFAGTPNKPSLKNIRDKFDTGHRNINSAFFENLLTENQSEYKLGAKVLSEEGERNIGTLSNIYWEVFVRAGVFKGKWASFGLFDEIGEFGDNPSLEDCYLESLDCFKEGDEWIGMPILSGTTDTKNMKNTHFMQMWQDCDAYNLRRVFIPANYFYSDKYFNFYTGKSDTEGAEKEIIKQKEKLAARRDKTALLKFRQNNPLSPDDMFLVMGNSAINLQRINEQIKKVNESPELKYFGQRGDLKWVMGVYGKEKDKWTVEWFPNEEGRWYKMFDPINHIFPDADIVGIDDFFQDVAQYSESLGGICVWRRFIPATSIVSNVPCMTYLYRPSVSEFHDDCLKTAVYYGAKAAIEFHNPMCKRHFLESEKVNGRLFMKTYPRIMGKVVNPDDAFGYHVGTLEKEMMMVKASEWVDSPALENCTDIGFLHQLCDICTTRNADLADAFGICLLYDSDLRTTPVRDKEQIEQGTVRRQPLMTMGENGIPRVNVRGTKETRMRNHKLAWQRTLNQ